MTRLTFAGSPLILSTTSVILVLALILASVLVMASDRAQSQTKNTFPGLALWSFEHNNTAVPVAIWHPTHDAPTHIDAGPFLLTAASRSAPLAGTHPLIVISHGTGGSNLAHHTVAESLASAGYVVAAIEHPGDNFRDRSLVGNTAYFRERPQQIQALLNALTTDPVYGPHIDPTRVGAVGHSVGGYSVTALIGAQADRDALVRHCAAVADDPACDYANTALGVSNPTDTPYTLPADADTVPAHVNIRSAALLAPMGSVISTQSTLDPDVNVLIAEARHHAVLPTQYHADAVRRAAPHATHRTVDCAGHFSFLAPINAAWHSEFGAVAKDPDGCDRTQVNAETNGILQDWFDSTLN